MARPVQSRSIFRCPQPHESVAVYQGQVGPRIAKHTGLRPENLLRGSASDAQLVAPSERARRRLSAGIGRSTVLAVVPANMEKSDGY